MPGTRLRSGEKSKKRDQIGKKESEASEAVAWGGGKVYGGRCGGSATLSPPQTTSRLASATPIIFSFFPQCGAWSHPPRSA